MRFRLPLLLLLAGAAAGASEPEPVPPFRVSGNAELWAYGAVTDRTTASPLNPANRVAQLPDPQWTGEARINLRVSRDGQELVLRPRALVQDNPGNGPGTRQAYLSQAFVRLRPANSLTLTAGRDLLTWGPASFRSPSNPLYFDAGRTEPMRDVPGVDLVRLGWTRGPLTLTVDRVLDAQRLEPAAPPPPMSLARLDLRGRDRLLGLVLATPVGGAPFYGAFAQATLDEAWLAYAEFGSGRRPAALTVSPDAQSTQGIQGAPFTVQTPSPRRETTLLGASYTLVNGQTAGLEWLRDGHGWSARQEAQYFTRASQIADAYRAAPDAPMAGQQLAGQGQGLGQAPALLGRDYLSLLWQSNLQESGHYWRLVWTGNLQDRGSQVLAYGELSLATRFTVFAALSRNLGGARTEAGCLFGTSLTLGVKCFVF
jgi:hypothetical protein